MPCEQIQRIDEIIRRLKFFVGYNRLNLVKFATKIITDENYDRRKYQPTKIITDKVVCMMSTIPTAFDRI